MFGAIVPLSAWGLPDLSPFSGLEPGMTRCRTNRGFFIMPRRFAVRRYQVRRLR
jgi:hypothetical protein